MSSSSKEAKIFNNQWILKKKVSSGSFGVVFIAQDKSTKELVAIKLEKEDNEDIRSLEREVQILTRLQGLNNIPKLYWSGQENNYNIMVVSLLGPDLAYYMKMMKKFSLKSVLMLADQLIPILESIHNRSIIHRDLKPENLLMGLGETTKNVYMIDFGISKIYRDSNGRHISFKENKPFIGTTRYASIAAHLGHELGRKDDLESLAYVLIFLIKGHLPWQSLQNVSDKDKTQAVGELKQKTKPQDLCKDLPHEFIKYLEYVKKLSFKSTPDYKYLKNLFQKLGAQNNVKYGANDYDWSDKDFQKEKEKEFALLRDNGVSIDKSQAIQSQQKLPSNLHKDDKKDQQQQQSNLDNQINRKPKEHSQQLLHISQSEISNELLKVPDVKGKDAKSNGQRTDNRKMSGMSFLGTQSSVYIKYQPSQMKDGSHIGPEVKDQKYDEKNDEEEVMIKGSALVIDQLLEEEKKGAGDKQSLDCDIDMDIDEYSNTQNTLENKVKYLQKGSVVSCLKSFSEKKILSYSNIDNHIVPQLNKH